VDILQSLISALIGEDSVLLEEYCDYCHCYFITFEIVVMIVIMAIPYLVCISILIPIPYPL
jgi:hypothetical protein